MGLKTTINFIKIFPSNDKEVLREHTSDIIDFVEVLIRDLNLTEKWIRELKSIENYSDDLINISDLQIKFKNFMPCGFSNNRLGIYLRTSNLLHLDLNLTAPIEFNSWNTERNSLFLKKAISIIKTHQNLFSVTQTGKTFYGNTTFLYLWLKSKRLYGLNLIGKTQASLKSTNNVGEIAGHFKNVIENTVGENIDLEIHQIDSYVNKCDEVLLKEFGVKELKQILGSIGVSTIKWFGVKKIIFY